MIYCWKRLPLSLFEQLKVTKSPVFRLTSPESSSNKGKNKLLFLNLNLDFAEKLISLWKCEY